MLQNPTWTATDDLTRDQFRVFSSLGEQLRMSEDDRRRVLLLTEQEWAHWSDFPRRWAVAGTSTGPGDAAAAWQRKLSPRGASRTPGMKS